MTKSKRLSSLGTLALALPIAVATAAWAADTPKATEKPVARAAAERAVGGQTREQRMTQMLDLNAQLASKLPAGVETKAVRVELTDEDIALINADTSANGPAPLRIGLVKAVASPVKISGGEGFDRGVTQASDDGTSVWAMTVSSPGAQAIRVHFTKVSLPDGAELFFFSDNGQADGPYTGTGRNGTGDFWTRSITSDSGVIQLHFNEADRGQISFVVSDVGHIRGRPPRPDFRSHDSWPCSDNAPCMVDAQCGGTDPAVNGAKDAVAKLEWIQGPFINTCTGGLIADTDTGTQVPLMLSANHCFNNDISNLETFFNYTTSSCNGSCPDSLVTGGTPPPADTVGMTVDATNSNSDYTLFTLSESPPAGAAFLGWNTTPVANNNGFNLYRISNANFGPQVYSEHTVDTGSPTCSGIPRGAWIYSKDQVGGTMGGSSGSPVVNSAGEIVGQLTGCCGFNCGNECDSASNWTIDGAFANYFSEVASILDPPGGGCTTNADCDDSNECTNDVCNAGTCENTAVADNTSCNGGAGICCGGTCSSATCSSDGDCDDGNLCTTDTCSNAGTCSASCSNDPVSCPPGETCDPADGLCKAPACDNDGFCEPGEDCNNCPNDCRAKTNGSPNSRYCCDGDLPDCGNTACSEGGWACGEPTPCTSDPDCDDGQFCNGAETCSGGTCQAGSDPCPGQGCDETNDVCVPCGGNKAPCNDNGDCCSGNYKNGACKGN